jgi:hypothetical protein
MRFDVSSGVLLLLMMLIHTPRYTTALRMAKMVDVINSTRLDGIGEVSCYTCHRGETKPSRLPREALDAEVAKWPATLTGDVERQKLTMAVYNASLGVGCDHCHDPSDWKSANKKPMQTVRRMLAMFDDFPKYMPEGARTQCYMCHKGSTKPPKS